jgi:SAM-dependent methyltransferase
VPDDEAVKQAVRDQFGAAAQNYVKSPTHALGGDLARLVELAALSGRERVLDIATGGGHAALAMAAGAREVVASDFTQAMLDAARAHLESLGVANVSFQLADAEALPFPDAGFDLVTTRVAPHHFPNPDRYVREVARVLRPGGRFLLDDNVAPEDQELDEFLNRLEKWRDPGHVRSHRVTQWRMWIEEAGLTVESVEPLERKRYEFDEWTTRIHMPQAERDGLEAWLLQAPPRCAEFFKLVIRDARVVSLDCTFAIIVSRKPS